MLEKQFSKCFTLWFRNDSFECFLAKKDLGPSGVNMKKSNKFVKVFAICNRNDSLELVFDE